MKSRVKLVHPSAGSCCLLSSRGSPKMCRSRPCGCSSLFHSFLVFSSASHPGFCFLSNSCCCLPFCPAHQQGRADPGSLHPLVSEHSAKVWELIPWGSGLASGVILFPGATGLSPVQALRGADSIPELRRAQMRMEKNHRISTDIWMVPCPGSWEATWLA